MKKLVSFALALIMLISMVIPVEAAREDKYLKEAEQLQLLGVFQGTSSGFELDRPPTRIEGLVMLIRLLGKEAEAKTLSYKTSPFTDIPSWATGYANFAHKYGLTKGIGNNLYGSNDKINAQSYITFMLRALEYDDSKGDFSYKDSLNFAMEKGILSSSDVSELTSEVFLRDHVAKVSMLSLVGKIKGKDITLLGKLVNEGTISDSVANQIVRGSEPNLEVHFIDVGQADSILIKKGKDSMLIDGGNNGDGNFIVNYLKKQNISKLKYIIGTHPHEDHIGGLDNVIDSFEVEKIIMSNAISTTKTFEDLLNSISNKGLTITKAKVGDKYNLNGATFTILGPNEESYSSLNDYSVIVKLTNGGNTFLFTGDAEELSEAELLLKNKELLKSDVLKLGHHGSTTSTSQAFLDTVNPRFAVISVEKDNSYGHPHKEILDRLTAKEIKIYRTDLLGTIIATSNGKTIGFSNNPIKDENSSPVTTLPPVKDIVISNLDKVGEIVTIMNNSSKDINLDGWRLLSVTGNQEFVFPSYVLKANGTVTVASGDEKGDLIWGKGNIWNNSSSDPAILYDAQGNEVFRFND